MSLMNACDITYAYSQHRQILNQLSLTVDSGDIHVILGRSGSGKTTLLNCLSGVIQPNQGDITLLNQSLSSLNEDQRADFRLQHIGILYQFFQLLPALTIQENILLPAQLLKMNTVIQLAHLADQFNITSILDQLPTQCSGGECQRAALCRALITKPSLLIADEPTGNLDVRTRDLILEYLKELSQTMKIGLIIATHDKALQDIATAIWELDNGQLNPVS